MSGSIGKRHFHHEMIHRPGRRLMHKVPLRFVQRRVAGGGGRSVNTSLALIPLIDFLVCVVLFLLMSFSASGEIPVDKNTKLPSAENYESMIDAPMIAISGRSILVDGAPAGSTAPIEESGRLQKIDDLHNILKQKQDLWKQVNPKGATFPGMVVMQVDHRVTALVVKSVFQTAAFAGYPNISFMVGQLPKSRPAGGEH